jgi:hypothetical protein
MEAARRRPPGAGAVGSSDDTPRLPTDGLSAVSLPILEENAMVLRAMASRAQSQAKQLAARGAAETEAGSKIQAAATKQIEVAQQRLHEARRVEAEAAAGEHEVDKKQAQVETSRHEADVVQGRVAEVQQRERAERSNAMATIEDGRSQGSGTLAADGQCMLADSELMGGELAALLQRFDALIGLADAQQRDCTDLRQSADLRRGAARAGVEHEMASVARGESMLETGHDLAALGGKHSDMARETAQQGAIWQTQAEALSLMAREVPMYVVGG